MNATGRTHTLKTWPQFFTPLATGRKTFEVRRDDRGFAVGDRLVLLEYDPSLGSEDSKRYTGRAITVEVTYLMKGGQFGIESGYVVMGIRINRGLA